MTIADGFSLTVDGRPISFASGDTVGVAMQRAGISTFTRSFKLHRRRGLMCLSGDCPNCLVTIDGVPLERGCVVTARPGQDVRRESGVPSVERDLLAINDRLRWLMPVGFYYKTMLRPRSAWPLVERMIRRVSGRGTPDPKAEPRARFRRHRRVDVAIVGGGVAGLSAAVSAAKAGASVYLCESYAIGALLPPGVVLDRALALAALARELECELVEGATAVGIYEGPLLVASTREGVDLVRPSRIVIATGASEELPVFSGNDLPGVWLSRGAELLAGKYGVAPGAQIVVAGVGADANAATLQSGPGPEITVVSGVRAAHGRGHVSRVTDDRGSRLQCDALVVSGRLRPRDNLARQASSDVLLAGDALSPGCDWTDAEDSGCAAGMSEQHAPTKPFSFPPPPKDGIVCLCEDVMAKDLDLAWFEGFTSMELLKRYTTATMGPCQGACCHDHLQGFVKSRLGDEHPASEPTTARPPARPLSVEDAAAGVVPVIEAHTALHDRHLALGAEMEPLGEWSRARTYGDPVAEYWAVRKGVSIMDVGTLGKFLVFGPGAEELLDRLLPCDIRGLPEGRVRYTLMLSEHGYVVDDGLVCRLDAQRFFVTFTSGGAQGAEAMMRDWADTWGLDVYIVDETAAKGAINLCGPDARLLLERLTDDPVSKAVLPYLHHRELNVADVSCRAIRLGFVGELSFELHHSAFDSVALWDALLHAGEDLGVVPHGTEALRTLRLEKGHLLIGQDTDLDASPDKLGMLALIKLEKPDFVGKEALIAILGRPPRRQLCAFEFLGDRAPVEGAPIRRNGAYVGHLTSARLSPVLGKGIGLGWIETDAEEATLEVEADGLRGVPAAHAFYDPEGDRVRA